MFRFFGPIAKLISSLTFSSLKRLCRGDKQVTETVIVTTLVIDVTPETARSYFVDYIDPYKKASDIDQENKNSCEASQSE